MEDTAPLNFFEYVKLIEMPMQEIASAANNFTDENLIAHGSYAKVYKGQLLLQSSAGETMDIAIRKFLPPLNASVVVHELTMYKDLKHKNILSLLRVDDTRDQAFLIHEHQVNQSLDKHLSDSTLTWMQRLQICVGVAEALCYLHYGLKDNYSVIHGNIKSSKILLNHNWEPKLHDFRCAMKGKRHELYPISKYNGSLEYMDPAFELTGGLTHKSDVFSFGVVLFEVLFGMKASVEDNDNWCFARLARRCYDEKTLDDMIDPDLRKQMGVESLNIFSHTAYLCVMEQRAKRPDIVQIVRKLETALELQQKHYQSLVHPTAAVEGTSANRLKGVNIDHLKIPLMDIKLATNNFSESFCIGSGGYGTVYKAELDVFDGMNPVAIEGKNKDELPKRHNTVALKRISNRVDGQGEQGFIVEVKLLSKCKHSNIVSLLGFCDEDNEMILVYEFASKGSLDNYLGNIDNMTHLTWVQRIQICLDIAHGLKYLHTSTHDKERIIHRDIKSANVLLDDHWVAKVADFGLSKSHYAHELGSTLITNNIAGTEVYLDPEYQETGKLKKESDIYSLGVVLFEIMCGKLAYDSTFKRGLPFVARQSFEEGTIKELVDPKLKEVDENIYILNEGVNQRSLDTFSKIAYKCLAEIQSQRPTIEVIIRELEKALNFQRMNKDSLHIPLEDIKLATKSFSDAKCIREGRYWKQYEGDLSFANVYNNGCAAIIAKRFDSKFPQGRHQFLTELKLLFKSKHGNIVSLVGYCNEMDERVIVYEHALNGGLDKHLDNASLTWMSRLKICIDIASGLDFLHTGGGVRGWIPMIHRDIKSSSILLDAEWKARISNLELSTQASESKEAEHVTDDNAYDSFSYVCPEYGDEQSYLTKESDIYSLGKILVKMLCRRRSTWNSKQMNFAFWFNRIFDQTSEEFQGIKEQIGPKSFATFLNLTYHCLEYKLHRPNAREVVNKLKKALQFQVDHEIIQLSKTPGSIEMKKELYDMFSKGILHDGKVWFSFGSNGEMNEMISATKFSYENILSPKCPSVEESRFQKVAEMFDLSKLMVKIKITTKLLSPDVNYGVYLIFKFCNTRKFSSKPMYVNLNYKMGGENMHAYFATWRDENWMEIELCRFLCTKKDTKFVALLESFSRCYCGSSAIYIEGVEFRAFDNMKHEKSHKIERVHQVVKSKSNEQQLSPNEVHGKKNFTVSMMKVRYNLPDRMKHVKYIDSFTIKSRFQEMVKPLTQQSYGMNFEIQSQILLPDTEYHCYFVFKLSKKCEGLHCRVKVRDPRHGYNKEAKIVYFRPPRSWNLHDIISVPEQREDGWMEVKVWKFISKHDLKTDSIRVTLKFTTYEGNMSGLIIGGFEFRSM